MLIQLNNSIRLCLRVEFLHPGHDEAFRSCNIIELRSAEKPVIHYSKKIKAGVPFQPTEWSWSALTRFWNCKWAEMNPCFSTSLKALLTSTLFKVRIYILSGLRLVFLKRFFGGGGTLDLTRTRAHSPHRHTCRNTRMHTARP